jgi:hypothetical protein
MIKKKTHHIKRTSAHSPNGMHLQLYEDQPFERESTFKAAMIEKYDKTAIPSDVLGSKIRKGQLRRPHEDIGLLLGHLHDQLYS